jgi:lipid II:glycine glycyltransferase (peptidoglycan interpeptide bridge formation enzyme)
VPIADEATMFKRLTKGHRADVKRAEREGVEVEILYGGNFPEDMRLFRELHAKAAGRVTRSLKTWAIQQRWVDDGYAFLALARKGALLAGALFIVYQSRAYYASSARDPDAPNEGAAHLILWRAMQWLGRNGYAELDMGPIPGVGAAQKEINIARFKKGFGACS